MGCQTQWFDAGVFADTGRLFSLEITDDPWILYHGTSRVFEDAIDADGLAWHPHTYSREDLVTLMKVFYSLRWDGTAGGGINTLSSFTRNDFRHGNAKPVYLGETAWRATRYATRDCAGGETARAVREAFHDLWLYISSRSVRDEHVAARPANYSHFEQWAELQPLLESRELFDAPDDQRVEWLEGQMGALVRLQARCFSPWVLHAGGVVYAVRIEPSDGTSLRCRGPGGLEWLGRLPQQRLLAKVHLPGDLEHTFDLYRNPAEEFRRLDPNRLANTVRRITAKPQREGHAAS